MKKGLFDDSDSEDESSIIKPTGSHTSKPENSSQSPKPASKPRSLFDDDDSENLSQSSRPTPADALKPKGTSRGLFDDDDDDDDTNDNDDDDGTKGGITESSPGNVAATASRVHEAAKDIFASLTSINDTGDVPAREEPSENKQSSAKRGLFDDEDGGEGGGSAAACDAASGLASAAKSTAAAVLDRTTTAMAASVDAVRSHVVSEPDNSNPDGPSGAVGQAEPASDDSPQAASLASNALESVAKGLSAATTSVENAKRSLFDDDDVDDDGEKPCKPDTSSASPRADDTGAKPKPPAQSHQSPKRGLFDEDEDEDGAKPMATASVVIAEAASVATSAAGAIAAGMSAAVAKASNCAGTTTADVDPLRTADSDSAPPTAEPESQGAPSVVDPLSQLGAAASQASSGVQGKLAGLSAPCHSTPNASGGVSSDPLSSLFKGAGTDNPHKVPASTSAKRGLFDDDNDDDDTGAASGGDPLVQEKSFPAVAVAQAQEAVGAAASTATSAVSAVTQAVSDLGKEASITADPVPDPVPAMAEAEDEYKPGVGFVTSTPTTKRKIGKSREEMAAAVSSAMQSAVVDHFGAPKSKARAGLFDSDDEDTSTAGRDTRDAPAGPDTTARVRTASGSRAHIRPVQGLFDDEGDNPKAEAFVKNALGSIGSNMSRPSIDPPEEDEGSSADEAVGVTVHGDNPLAETKKTKKSREQVAAAAVKTVFDAPEEKLKRDKRKVQLGLFDDDDDDDDGRAKPQPKPAVSASHHLLDDDDDESTGSGGLFRSNGQADLFPSDARALADEVKTLRERISSVHSDHCSTDEDNFVVAQPKARRRSSVRSAAAPVLSAETTNRQSVSSTKSVEETTLPDVLTVTAGDFLSTGGGIFGGSDDESKRGKNDGSGKGSGGHKKKAGRGSLAAASGLFDDLDEADEDGDGAGDYSEGDGEDLTALARQADQAAAKPIQRKDLFDATDDSTEKWTKDDAERAGLHNFGEGEEMKGIDELNASARALIEDRELLSTNDRELEDIGSILNKSGAEEIIQDIDTTVQATPAAEVSESELLSMLSKASTATGEAGAEKDGVAPADATDPTALLESLDFSSYIAQNQQASGSLFD